MYIYIMFYILTCIYVCMYIFVFFVDTIHCGVASRGARGADARNNITLIITC